MGESESRPTRNGRRSASVRSRTRMMCGVSVRMTSVCVVDFVLCANRRPTSGMSLRPGHAVERVAFFVADQARQHVRLAVTQPDDRLDFAIAERRQPAEARAGDVGDRHRQVQRYVVVVVHARRDVDVHADVLVVERRDRLLRRAARRNRRERRDGDRHAIAEFRLRRQCPPTSGAAGSRACACSSRS